MGCPRGVPSRVCRPGTTHGAVPTVDPPLQCPSSWHPLGRSIGGTIVPTRGPEAEVTRPRFVASREVGWQPTGASEVRAPHPAPRRPAAPESCGTCGSWGTGVGTWPPVVPMSVGGRCVQLRCTGSLAGRPQCSPAQASPRVGAAGSRTPRPRLRSWVLPRVPPRALTVARLSSNAEPPSFCLCLVSLKYTRRELSSAHGQVTLARLRRPRDTQLQAEWHPGSQTAPPASAPSPGLCSHTVSDPRRPSSGRLRGPRAQPLMAPGRKG